MCPCLLWGYITVWKYLLFSTIGIGIVHILGWLSGTWWVELQLRLYITRTQQENYRVHIIHLYPYTVLCPIIIPALIFHFHLHLWKHWHLCLSFDFFLVYLKGWYEIRKTWLLSSLSYVRYYSYLHLAAIPHTAFGPERCCFWNKTDLFF